MRIPIFQITVNDGRREADPEAVQELADSISKVGLLNAITVDQDYTLIAGLHRLEAAKLLGWTEIECNVSSLEGLLARLAEIDENLIRHELDHMEEWEQLARRKEIYEMLHPETRRGMRNGQTSKTDTGSVLEAKSFAQDTAEKTGVTPRTVERKVQIAKKLTPEAKGIVKEHDIGFKNALKLSRLAPDQQEDAASQLASKAIRSVDDYRPPLAESGTTEEPEPEPEAPPDTGQTTPPPEVPAPLLPENGYYATIRDSVNDLKNPDKDRRRTPDTFIATISYFLQKFCQSLNGYADGECEVVIQELSQEHLGLIYAEISSVHNALNDLYNKIERMART